MIKYFRDLLAILRSIDARLAKLEACVRVNHHDHGDRASISTKHWND